MLKNENGEFIVEHHIKYKEMHGYDKTVWVTQKDHIKLHHKLRKDGKCTILPCELNKISNTAHHRTDKCKERRQQYQKKYQESDFYKNSQKEYRESEEHKEKQQEYMKEYQKLDKYKTYRNTKEFKEYQKEYNKKYYAKRKLEKEK